MNEELDVQFRKFKNRIVGYGIERADQLLAHPENWAIHPKSQRDAMKSTLESLGWVMPLVVNVQTKHVLDGHLRDDIAIEADDPVPVVYVDLSPEEEIQALATINTIAMQAKVDKEKMQALRDQLTNLSPSLEGLLARATGTSRKMPDRATSAEELAELADEWDTAEGQVWKIAGGAGFHYIVCGSSTDRILVNRVLTLARPSLIVTDPPYGVDYIKTKSGMNIKGFEDIGERFEDIKGDTTPEIRPLLVASLGFALENAVTGAAVYVWHPPLSASNEFYAALDDLDIVPHRQIVWVKPSLVMTRSGMYHWRHEVCIFGWRRGDMPEWFGPKNQTTVWEMDRAGDKLPHPTQKPLAAYTTPMQNHTRKGGVCYDPFAGSFTVVEAAERAERCAVAIELDPKYVALGLARAASMSLKPELL